MNSELLFFFGRLLILWVLSIVFIDPVQAHVPNEVSEDCQIEFVRGHGEMVTAYVRKQKIFRPGVTCAKLGCMVGKQDPQIPFDAEIQSYVGDWMDDRSEIYNGGFDPELNKDSSLSPNEEWREGIEVHSVGFARLQSKLWLASLAAGVEKIKSKKCKMLKVSVICPSSDRQNEIYENRISVAKSTRLKDIDGKSIRFELENCGLDQSGHYTVQNQPGSCGDRFYLGEDFQSACNLNIFGTRRGGGFMSSGCGK